MQVEFCQIKDVGSVSCGRLRARITITVSPWRLHRDVFRYQRVFANSISVEFGPPARVWLFSCDSGIINRKHRRSK